MKRRFHRLGPLTVALLLLLAPVARSQLIEGEIKEGFKRAFVDPASGRRTSLLSGLSATNISNEALLVVQPQLQLFSDDGKTNLTVASPQCVFNTQRKLVSSAEKLRAASADARFSLDGNGFQYEVATGALVVSNQVHAVVRKDLLGPEPPPRAARGAGQSGLESPAAGQFVHIYSDHLRYQTNLAVFEDDVRVHDPQGGMTCGSLTVKFTEPAQRDQRRGIDRILAEQNVVIDSEELHATGDRATYQQASDVVELTGHPAWRLRQHEGRAEELTVNRKTREFHAARSVEMTLPQDSIGRRGFLLPENPAQSNPASIQDQPVRVRAEDFEFQPDLANTNLNLAVFCGQVQVQSGKGNLSCEIMSIKSSAPDNRTQSAVAQGGVVMEQGDKRVTGDEAVYTAATETVEVTGRPAWKMGPREGVAEALKFDLTNGVYRATRNVRMRLPAGSFGSSTWLLPETRDGVSASAPATASVRATQSPQGPIEVSCDEFEFQAAVPDVKTDTATYRGNVLVKDPERMQVSGERLTAKMLPGTNQVETVVVEQKVDIAIEEPGGERHAHGDKAVYTAADGQVMLTSDARVEIRFVEPRIDGRATGAKAVYASAKDTLELTGDPVVTLPYGQAWGDVVILDRSNTVLSATGNWRLKLDPELLNKAAKPALKPQSSGKTGSLHED